MTEYASHRQRIIEALRLSTRPLDDDELAVRAGISPRQTVNQVCHRLAAEGVLRRRSGHEGKLVNVLVGQGDGDLASRTPASAKPSDTPEVSGAVPPGSSAEQRAAERHMLDALGDRLGVVLEPRTLGHPAGATVQLDGADEALTVLVECWAHQGPAKVAQKHKLMNDAVKLHWIATTLPHVPRLVLCLSDEAAGQHLVGRSWQGQALRDLGVDVEVVSLPVEIREAIITAQRRQFR